MNTHLDQKDTELLAAIEAAHATHEGPRRGDFVYFKKTGQLERISQDLGKTMQTSPAGSFCISKSGYSSFSGALNPGTPTARLKLSSAVLQGKFWFFHHGTAGPDRGVDVEIECRVYITSAKYVGLISSPFQPFDALAMACSIERQLMHEKHAKRMANASGTGVQPNA